MSGYGRAGTGRVVLAAAWGLLRSDRSLLLLPVLSALSAAVAGALVMVPGILLVLPARGRTLDAAQLGAGAVVGGLLLLWLSVFVVTVVAVFFQVALVCAVFERLDGGDPTVGSAVRAARERLRPILLWSALSATVGTLLRLLEERGILGAIASLVMSIGWALASFFVVPIIAYERITPRAALTRSAALFRDTWGPSARATLRYGLVYFLVLLPGLLVLGLMIFSIGSPGALTLGLAAIAVVYLVAAGIVLSALGVVVRAVLYRYAAGLPVPGVDTTALAGALR